MREDTWKLLRALQSKAASYAYFSEAKRMRGGCVPVAEIIWDAQRLCGAVSWSTVRVHDAYEELMDLGYIFTFYDPGPPLMPTFIQPPPYSLSLPVHYFDPLGKKGVRAVKFVDPALYPDPTKFIKRYGNAKASARPSFDEMGVRTARLWAERSADPKFKVGVAILSNDSHTMVSLGYNGRYPGSPTEKRASEKTGGSQYTHGEINALLRARWEHGEKHTLYSTLEPCHDCALAILAARHISRVVFESSYAGDGVRRRGSEILRDAGVEVVQWDSWAPPLPTSVV